MLNTYRVSFHFVSGEKMTTILKSTSLVDLKDKVLKKISSKRNSFLVEKKHNRYFFVNQENVCFIHYEILLKNNKDFSFENIEEMDINNLKIALKEVEDIHIIKSLNGEIPEIIYAFQEALQAKRWTNITSNVYWQTSLLENDILESKKIIVETILKLESKKIIEL